MSSQIEDLMNKAIRHAQTIGAEHSNVVTGDFSVSTDNAFRIENGAVAYPLKACTVAENLYQALNAISAIGNGSRTFPLVVKPSVAIEKIVVST